MFHRPKMEGQEPAKKEETATMPQAQQAAMAVKAPEKKEEAVSEGVKTMAERQVVKQNAAPQAETATVNRNDNSKTEEKKMNSKEDQQEKQQGRPIDIPGSHSSPSYHAPQAPRVPGYAGSYPGAAGGSSVYGASADKKVSAGRRLVIGEGITMSGEIEACEFLIVEGTVEAALKGASVLEIAESGTFYGTVEIDEATVAGRFEGEITVNGRLTITSTGSITGTIAYKELAIDAGATLDGKVSPLSGSKAAAKKTDKAGAPTKSMKPSNRNEGEDGNELPFAGNAAAAG